jgi:hypothetical protein
LHAIDSLVHYAQLMWIDFESDTHQPDSWWICHSTVGLQPLYHMGILALCQ